MSQDIGCALPLSYRDGDGCERRWKPMHTKTVLKQIEWGRIFTASEAGAWSFDDKWSEGVHKEADFHTRFSLDLLCEKTNRKKNTLFPSRFLICRQLFSSSFFLATSFTLQHQVFLATLTWDLLCSGLFASDWLMQQLIHTFFFSTNNLLF